MGIRSINFVEGEYFHIFNRGNSKQKIFLDKEDYLRFIKLLYLCNSTRSINFRDDIVAKKIDAWEFERGNQIISIGSWVLMPNHFHLCITIPRSLASGKDDKNGISEFMLKLCTSYSKYFNKKYNRTGSLFEGKFKSVHLEDDRQLKYLFSYIHLNPIKLIDKNWREYKVNNKTKVVNFISTYKWSSYLDYCGNDRIEGVILNKLDFPKYFTNSKEYSSEVFDWLKPLPLSLA